MEEENVLKGFKEFIMRGNVVDLAVAVVLGAAFGAVITSLVENLLTPVIALIVGEPDFSGLTFEISGTIFSYGSFFNSLISFVSIAGAIYFFVVVPMNRLKGAEEVTTRDCPQCTTEIPLAAKRCPACTAQIAPTG
ncbi:MAG: large conductance mechanosensitive channel protein MscL [Solirubrobacterales bacterium]